MMDKFTKYWMLFMIGGAIYCLIELLFRGHSYEAMFAVGGICFILIGLINEHTRRCMPLVIQMLIGAMIITAIELVSGIILNRWMGLGMWDYSHLPGNVLGQICPQFTALWFLLSAVGIVFDDMLRWIFFGEEKPHYHLLYKRPGEK